MKMLETMYMFLFKWTANSLNGIVQGCMLSIDLKYCFEALPR